MGFMDEILSIQNDINYMQYNSKGVSFMNKLFYKWHARRLRRIINNISETQISTKMIFEFVEYYLNNFEVGTKSSFIKQVSKTSNGVYQIVFEIAMPDNFYGLVNIQTGPNSLENTIGNYTYTVIAPNSSKYINHSYKEEILVTDISIDMSEMGKLDNGRLIKALRNIFIKEITKHIKETLLNNIELKEDLSK